MIRPFGEVYLLTNTVNGKQYVGQTTRGAKYRWRDHQHDAKRRGNKSVLGRAIRKYGATSFTITVLDFAYDPNHPKLPRLRLFVPGSANVPGAV